MAIQRGLVSCGAAVLIHALLPAPAGGAVAEDYAEVLSSIAETEQLRQWHDLLGSEPHVAGTVGDRRAIERLRNAFEEMGLQTEVHEFTALLPRTAPLHCFTALPNCTASPRCFDALRHCTASPH